MKIGFIGQGFIGKNYANDFENRGFEVVRYSVEPQYIENREKIATCDIVFIAVPTPTTPMGFDVSILRKVIPLIGKGKIAVIKSTMLPGTTRVLASEFPDIFVMNSPEFLREASAAYDASYPERNIIGIVEESEEMKNKAEEVLSVLPIAPFKMICKAEEAELIKYAGNCFLFTKVIFMNMLYDLAQKENVSWENIKDALTHDSRIGKSHMNPVDDNGRGAGGNCFIKDFKAFTDHFEKQVEDKGYKDILESLQNKNVELLRGSGKNLDLLSGVFGSEILIK